MFPADLETRAYRAGNGEFGWTREEARIAIAVLVDKQLAILGGEVWWVPEGESGWTGIIPQRRGPPGVYHWDTEREAQEEWLAYVQRCGMHSLQAIDAMPASDDVPTDLSGRILYNLSWVSEDELWALKKRMSRWGLKAP
jgi:hypothetical protein